ncbi:uncharacterized protein LOC119694476 [Plutella xylostella]|uniref:uncharacterized protein LOC119694476 n=1 Tax=Plutella xylostella TaxID=51655 RepID=UPI002032F0B2|nr:uncharacterized protein LOC119694476 [Plutella xylostella]
MVSLLGEGGRAAAAAAALRPRHWLLLALVAAGSFLLLSISSGSELVFLAPAPAPWRPPPAPPRYAIRTPGCTIPDLRALDPAVRPFVRTPRAEPCRNSQHPLVSRNLTHLWLNRPNLSFYPMPDRGNVTCCYKSFYRPARVDDVEAPADDRVQYDDCVWFDDAVEVTREFARVTCLSADATVYDDFHLFALPREPERRRNDSAAPDYNVIVMGVDGVSRLNFHRTMPKTLAYIKSKGAIELLGYNKVGDNTFPNLVPMLLGAYDTDIEKMCYLKRKKTFDNCPFVWEQFRSAGFLTAFGEDSAFLGTFNYGKHGFVTTPTDYYLRTFISEAEATVGNNVDFNTAICLGDRYFYSVLLDYIRDLTAVLSPASRLFGFFWEVTMSHDHLNYPMLMDDDYERFFRHVDASGFLNETVVLFLSDHGIRWGDIRRTKQGRLEERLPMAYWLLPPSFRARYPRAARALRDNARRLTTPFDVHATLADLADAAALSDDSLARRAAEARPDRRGISLFLDVPGNRTCELAGIADHWCTCHAGARVPVRGAAVQAAAAALVRHVNDALRGAAGCRTLRLDEVLDAAELAERGTGGAAGEEGGWRELTLVARTAPGGALLEATLRAAGAGWALAGAVSRLNLYGEQSRCVADPTLKLYCYCY